jgi:hypothetical protein
VRELLRFCTKDKVTLVFGGHPLVFFGMGLLKRIRPLEYAYWIGDYFPSSHPAIRLYERVKKWYHDRVAYAFYLSDAINRVMNGTVVDTARQRTVMWGLKPVSCCACRAAVIVLPAVRRFDPAWAGA